MLKAKYIYILLMLLGLSATTTSCSDDDRKSVSPTFSTITVTPEKDVYRVGDVVTCSISRLSDGTPDLKESSYWWYASWWFADSEMKADFQDFDESGMNTSSEITLTRAGDVTLYFFGKLEFPNFDWRKVEIGHTITVVE